MSPKTYVSRCSSLKILRGEIERLKLKQIFRFLPKYSIFPKSFEELTPKPIISEPVLSKRKGKLHTLLG